MQSVIIVTRVQSFPSLSLYLGHGKMQTMGVASGVTIRLMFCRRRARQEVTYPA